MGQSQGKEQVNKFQELSDYLVQEMYEGRTECLDILLGKSEEKKQKKHLINQFKLKNIDDLLLCDHKYTLLHLAVCSHPCGVQYLLSNGADVLLQAQGPLVTKKESYCKLSHLDFYRNRESYKDREKDYVAYFDHCGLDMDPNLKNEEKSFTNLMLCIIFCPDEQLVPIMTLLIDAVEEKNDFTVEKYVNHTTELFGTSALMLAVKRDHAEAIELLLHNGADSRIQDSFDYKAGDFDKNGTFFEVECRCISKEAYEVLSSREHRVPKVLIQIICDYVGFDEDVRQFKRGLDSDNDDPDSDTYDYHAQDRRDEEKEK